MKRGSNQSIDTKYAAILVKHALQALEEGKIIKAWELLKQAIRLLPEM